MKSFYFVRHGQTEWNAISRMQGQMDSDLTALGREQADTHAGLLASLAIETLFASPLNRARQTAEIVQRVVGADVRYDPRIKEWDCGDWSGYRYEDVKQKWPDEWAAFEADRFNYRGPRCENYPDMIERVTPFVDELVHTQTDNIGIISHGLIGRVMIGILLRFSEVEMLSFGQPNQVVYRVRFTENVLDSRSAKLHYYRSAEGPFEGTVASWRARSQVA